MQVNPYILVPLIAWVIAQWLKFSIAAFRGDINFRYLYASGGMPSVHSAVVTSLFLTTLFREGSMSPLVGITAILAGIVIYDSLGVRRSTGEQAVVLNALVNGLEEQRISFSTNVAKVREVLGHQPSEVFWGIITGAVVAILGNASYLSKQFKFLTASPAAMELYAHLAILGVILIVLVASLFIYRKRRQQAGDQTVGLLTWLAMALVGAGLFIGLAQYEKLAVFGARWPLYLVYVVLAILGYYIVRGLRRLPAKQTQTDPTSKDAWLAKERKKKRKK